MPDNARPGKTARKGPVDKRLTKELPGLRWGVAGSVAAGLLGTGSVVVQAVAISSLLAGAMPGAHPGDRARAFAWLAAGLVGRALAGAGGEFVAGASAAGAKAALRARLVMAALRVGPGDEGAGGPPVAPAVPRGIPGRRTPAAPGEFPGGAGELATLAGRGLDALDVYIGRCLPDLVLAVVAPIALLAAVGVLDWVSAGVLAIVVVLFPVFGALVGRASMALATERWKRVEHLGLQVADLFQGLPALRAFGRTAVQRERITSANEALRNSSSKVLRVAFLSALVLDTLGSFSVALVAVPLGLRLLNGSVRLSSALAVLVVAPEVFLPLRRASAEFHESTEGLAAAGRALALIGAPVLALGTGGEEPPDPLQVPVRLCSVTVGFPARDAPVLAGASLLIDPGETVVLVGPSGAGKSTVISLLLGFVTPWSGSVIAGGQDLARLDPDQWRRHLTYLPEHPTLLAGTLAENLRLANAAATEAELAEALARAGAVDLLARLPRGLATPIGEGGRPVSAGERQRIALARVFLRPRSLYLLDEPTVHLDRDGEAGVLEALRSELAGRSALIVSHRPAVLSLADRVVVLVDGKLAPLGGGQMAEVLG
jgi:thiol reductant ABC exporter CydD subunit